MRTFAFGMAVAALCLMWCTDAAAQLFGTDEGTGYQAIQQRVDRFGETVIIVRLDVDDYAPEGRLRSLAARTAQRARIRTQQNLVLNAVPGNHVRIKRRYEFLPYLALVVDAVGLQSISRAPGISLIQPDITGTVDVAESRLVVGADVANAAGCDGQDWAVAILDSGVDLDHDAFAGKIVREACFSTHLPGSDQESMCPSSATESTVAGSGDDCSPGEFPGLICPHGSLVAGVAGGNGGGIVGIAPQADLIAVRVFTHYTDGADCPGGAGVFPSGCPLVNASDLMAAIEHVGALSDTINVAAINISVDMTLTPGGPTASTSACDGVAALTGIKDAVDFTNSLGIPTVASTGNQNKTDRINPPSCLSNVVSVAYTQDGSTFGTGTVVDAIGHDPNRASFMDFWAPGEWITSAWPNNTTNTVRGTSVASPHVAGAIAALRSKGTASDGDYYVNLLKSTGVDVTDTTPDPDITKPRIDVEAACNALSAVSLDATVLLQGPYASAGKMTLAPAYTDSIPTTQPFGDAAYSGTPISYSGSEAVISFPDSTIDWVLVELRSDTTAASIVVQTPGFLLANGSVVGLHGDPLGFVGVDSTDYYVVIRQRNHIPVMSSSKVSFASGTGTWNFTTALAQAYVSGAGSPMRDLGDGRFAMLAADGNKDGIVTAPDFNLFSSQTSAGAKGYQSADYNMDGIVTAPDFNAFSANTSIGAMSHVPE